MLAGNAGQLLPEAIYKRFVRGPFLIVHIQQKSGIAKWLPIPADFVITGLYCCQSKVTSMQRILLMISRWDGLLSLCTLAPPSSSSKASLSEMPSSSVNSTSGRISAFRRRDRWKVKQHERHVKENSCFFPQCLVKWTNNSLLIFYVSKAFNH